MKVLFQSRRSLFEIPGGDTVQLLKTADSLRALGLEVDISTELEPDLSGYELVHLFNMTRPQESFMQAANAKRQGKKVALSTIYVDYSEFEQRARSGVTGLIARILTPTAREHLKAIARAVKAGHTDPSTLLLLRSGYRELQIRLFELADILLPNSESERGRVIEHFPTAATKPYHVVPNGIDVDLFTVGPSSPDSQPPLPFKDYVLCVGRIEGLKNQLSLVRAMNTLPWPLVLIGSPAPNHLAYYREVCRAAGPNVHILGPVPHEQLPRYYTAAKVHCLVSWMETTGLSSLEAGATGCNLVITDKGDTRDYFKGFAQYCDPADVNSIREAIRVAFEQPRSKALADHIQQHFNWQAAATATLQAYQQVLSPSSVNESAH